ncbi:hypothetical protein niasHT_011936 [Heterodera trifolii]|uniref:J domain-containing protein n=1 Tax=Heterodera trifolii TaxID=157864 RepID=A0ABD2KX11_9BILA
MDELGMDEFMDELGMDELDMFGTDNDNGESSLGGDNFTYSSERNEENVEEINFYGILNVLKDATMDEIHKAYKQKCLLFHPDKQRNLSDADMEKVERTFAEVQRAHKILVDPCMRRIYDVMGVRGINLEGWQLVDQKSSAENIRKEYEFLCRLRENEIVMQMFNPESDLFAKFSLVGCFQSVDRYGPELVAMRINQTVDFALFGSHKIGIGGATQFDDKGIGNGTVQLLHKWAYSIGMQQETTLNISPKMVHFSPRFIFVNSSPGSFLHKYSVVIEPTLRYSFSNAKLLPSLSAKLNVPLMPGWHGVVALNFFGSASISLFHFNVHNRPRLFVTFSLPAASFPSVRVVYHNSNSDCHWIVQADISMSQITPSLSYERRLSQHLRVALKLKLSYPSFLLQSSIKIRTSMSTFEFCFVLCDNQEDIVQAFVSGVVFPFIAFNTARFIYRRLRNGKTS